MICKYIPCFFEQLKRVIEIFNNKSCAISALLSAVKLNEANDFLEENPEIQFVDLLIADMSGVVRVKRI